MLVDSRGYESLVTPTTPIPFTNTFSRIEDKYFVPKSMKPMLMEVLNKQMKPFYPLATTTFTDVESIYYDSPSLDIYTQHFLSKSARYKIRTRRYAPNGFWIPDRVHLELKTKEDGVSRKTRFLMGPHEIKALTQGLPVRLTKELVRLNPETKSRALEKRLNRLNGLIRKNSLIPTCRVAYTRLAFESGDLRVTVDDQIQSELMAKQTVAYARARRTKLPPTLLEEAKQMLEHFNRDDFLVLEVKHHGRLPAWLGDFLKRSGGGKVAFSKYCYSMTRYLLSN